MPIVVRPATENELSEILRLTYLEYLRKGLIQPRLTREFSLCPHLDNLPETIPLVAVDGCKIVGTVTITFDGLRGLQSDSDYPSETDFIRHQGRPLASVWRLVSRHSSLHVPLALMREATRICLDAGEPTVLIECHPHGSFTYKKMRFEKFGERKQTSGLINAPSVLMIGGQGTYSRLLSKG